MPTAAADHTGAYPAVIMAMSDELKAEVAATARMLATAGLVEAFGHVSARLDAQRFLITSTLPLLGATAGTVITVDAAGAVIDNPAGAAPLEIPLHAAIYRARSDVGAICRGHGSAIVAWGVGTADVPLLHGLGAIAGVRIPVHPDFDLIASSEAAEGGCGHSGDASCSAATRQRRIGGRR